MELLILPILAILGLTFLLTGDDNDGGGGGGDGINDGNPNANFGSTDDVYAGEDGVQHLYLGGGNDVATGGAGDDRIFMGAGNDSSSSEDGSIGTPEDQAGNDLIRGGNGADRLTDAVGTNALFGDSGWDLLNGVDAQDDRGTPDALFGGWGADTLEGDDGDVLSGGQNGGQNNDIFDQFGVTVFEGADPVTITDWEVGERIVIRGEDGTPVFVETISTEVAENGTDLNILLEGDVVAILSDVTEIPTNTFQNPSAAVLFGTEADEDITIPDNVSQVYSRGGDDRITFEDGSAEATEGRDMQINSGHGNDYIAAGAGDDLLNGNLGADYIHGRGGFDIINGGFGDDELHGEDSTQQDGQADEIDGGQGNDRIYADDGDVVTGGLGIDTFYGVFDHASDDAVTIEDFDPANEALIITIPLPIEAIALPVTIEADGENTLIKYGDRLMFVLENVLASDVDPTDITIINSGS